jgi:hypothetical protein
MIVLRIDVVVVAAAATNEDFVDVAPVAEVVAKLMVFELVAVVDW